MNFFFIAICSLAMVFSLTACQDSTPNNSQTENLPTLSFSAIPDQNTTELRQKFDAVAAYLSRELNVPVRYIPSQNYAASVEMFKRGEIQLAWFGGLTGVQARQTVAGATAIAQGKADPQYVSYFIAHKSTNLERQQSFPLVIKDLPFAFGSAQSTSGHLMPAHFIAQETGTNPKDFFTHATVFSGSHDKTLDLVKTGGVIKAGVLSYKVYEKHLSLNPNLAESVKIIWVTPPYADYNFTAHPVLEERYSSGFTQKLQQTLIEMKDPTLLAAFPREAIIETTNSQYEAIADIARANGFIR